MIDGIIANLFNIIYLVPILLIALPVHEFSHALAATLLGDPTPKNMGRLTLNPLKHLDPIGSIFLVIFQFGWAKPVVINPHNFKNPKEAGAIVSLAGPMSNFIMAVISILLYVKLSHMMHPYLAYFLSLFAWINIGLTIFNLLPVPPLDGSNILAYFLPNKVLYSMQKYYSIFQLIIFVALFTGILSKPLGFMVSTLYINLSYLARMLPF